MESAMAAGRVALRGLRLCLLLAPLPVFAGQPAWHVFARDDGCVELAQLARAERLPRVPASPEDYARMLRERGERVVMGPPPGFPPELAGKAVQVMRGDGKAPVFVTDELCRNADTGSR